jgi:hypothetical protein
MIYFHLQLRNHSFMSLLVIVRVLVGVFVTDVFPLFLEVNKF